MSVLDLNQAEEQREALGPIPPDSAVKVRLSIRSPQSHKQGSHPLLTVSTSGYEFLDCEMEVLAGTFQGKTIWENFGVPAANYSGYNSGQQKGVDIAVRKLRAIVEAVRGINPKDQSPQASRGRILNDWSELQGMEFGIIVDCQKPKAGDRYVNNSIKRVITPDHEFYQHVMAGGEHITTKPVPELPDAPAGGANPAPAWGQGGQQAQPAAPRQGTLPAGQGQQYRGAPPAAGQPRQGNPAPAWGQKPGAAAAPPPPPPGQAFPSNAVGMDDVPF